MGICAISGADLTITNGSFACDYADVYNYGGTNANGRSTSIAIKGGTYKFSPTSFLAEGYKAQQDGEVWNVVKE